MPYAVATSPSVLDYLLSLADVSAACLEQLIRDYETELTRDADRLYEVGKSGPFCFRVDYPVPDGDTQRVFRLEVSMESAAGGIVRVVYAEHEVVGRV